MSDTINIYGYNITELLTNRQIQLADDDEDFENVLICLDRMFDNSHRLMNSTGLNDIEIKMKCNTHAPNLTENDDKQKMSFELMNRNSDNHSQSSHTSDGTCKKKKGRCQEVFPKILFRLLETSDTREYSYIISWLPHGRAFKIHDEALFEEHVLKEYFNSTLASFKHQLYSYGFKKIGKRSIDTGAYFHKQFIREGKDLCGKVTKWNGIQSDLTRCSPNFDRVPTTLKNLN